MPNPDASPAGDGAVRYAKQARWRVRNPHKVAAHKAVRRALERGEVRAETCWCGEPGEAHHGDYSKPLDVRWLCRKHHKAEHRTGPRAQAPAEPEDGRTDPEVRP